MGIINNRSGGFTKYFFNGTFDLIKNIDPFFDGNLNPSNPLWLSAPTFNAWNGTLDEVRIYNRALSDSEISALYSATK